MDFMNLYDIFLKMKSLSIFQLENIYYTRFFKEKIRSLSALSSKSLGLNFIWPGKLETYPIGNHPIRGFSHDIHYYENYGCSPVFLETCPKKIQSHSYTSYVCDQQYLQYNNLTTKPHNHAMDDFCAISPTLVYFLVCARNTLIWFYFKVLANLENHATITLLGCASH